MKTLTSKIGISEAQIVSYNEDMLEEMMELFYNTIHVVCAKDYTRRQLNRWAPLHPDVTAWKQRLNKNVCKVAVIENVVVGFSELTEDAHVDCMYVHKDYQRKNIARILLKELQQIAEERNYEVLTTEASITAKPFFEKLGFRVMQIRKKLYNGKEFTNYKMIKQL